MSHFFNQEDARVFIDDLSKNHFSDVEESLDVWGFADSFFHINANREVAFTGRRYPLGGKTLPTLLPWIEQVLGVKLDPNDVHTAQAATPTPEPVCHQPFIDDIALFLSPEQITTAAKARLRHGHGHTQEEMFAIKYASLARVPDLVVYPNNEAQVAQLVAKAVLHSVCLIPFGGGTSVTEALRPPQDELRMIVSVDMRRMNRIHWIDKVNHTACIEAGAVGRHIADALAKHGYTLGHEPDSVEFSTLGGWIATNASGMKKNKYGNIEDIVVDMHVVVADGELSRVAPMPRESVGVDARKWLFGSEGNFGIITKAVVRLFPLPKLQQYGSIIFPDFAHGVAFMYNLAQCSTWPASVRLVDNLQFQFGLALKPGKSSLHHLKSRLEKFYVTRLRGFVPDTMVACTLVFEGTAANVRMQEDMVYKLASRFHGMKAGADNGKRGYQLTYSIAYIRDFVMKHYVLAESFETSVPWDRVLELCERVKRRIHVEHVKHQLPGQPFVTCRVTQIYSTGVCVYFYFGFYYKGVKNPSKVYNDIETAAREEILQAGGSLSHHHGIGKLRQTFLPKIMSSATLAWNKHAKQAVDPKNIFGSGNLYRS